MISQSVIKVLEIQKLIDNYEQYIKARSMPGYETISMCTAISERNLADDGRQRASDVLGFDLLKTQVLCMSF